MVAGILRTPHDAHKALENVDLKGKPLRSDIFLMGSVPIWLHCAKLSQEAAFRFLGFHQPDHFRSFRVSELSASPPHYGKKQPKTAPK